MAANKTDIVTFLVEGVSAWDPVARTKQDELNQVALATLMFESARRYCHDCQCVVLTDQHTNLDLLGPDVTIHRADVDLTKLICERTRLQVEFLRTTSAERVVFCDTDMLFLDDVSRWFEEAFDVGLTVRGTPDSDMPINGGLILVRNTPDRKGLHFMERVLDTTLRHYRDSAEWFGDQYALRDVVGAETLRRGWHSIVESQGIRIALLPRDVYNWTPPGNWSSIAIRPRGVKLAHFKGRSKELMPSFFQAYVDRSIRRRFRSRLMILGRALRERGRSLVRPASANGHS